MGVANDRARREEDGTPEPTLSERAGAHETAGKDPFHASRLALLQAHIEDWPTTRGDAFVALIFGDFDPPDRRLTFDRLRISIAPGQVETNVIRSARTVLEARVAVTDKSIAAVKDAARRLNRLVGALSALHAGAPIRWWSHPTHPLRWWTTTTPCSSGPASGASCNASKGTTALPDWLDSDYCRRYGPERQSRNW